MLRAHPTDVKRAFPALTQNRRALPGNRPPDSNFSCRSNQHMTDVYGYLLATVSPDGAISFEFKQIGESDVTDSTRKDYKDEFIHSCFAGNSSPYVPDGPSCPTQ